MVRQTLKRVKKLRLRITQRSTSMFLFHLKMILHQIERLQYLPIFLALSARAEQMELCMRSFLSVGVVAGYSSSVKRRSSLRVAETLIFTPLRQNSFSAEKEPARAVA